MSSYAFSLGYGNINESIIHFPFTQIKRRVRPETNVYLLRERGLMRFIWEEYTWNGIEPEKIIVSNKVVIYRT